MAEKDSNLYNTIRILYFLFIVKPLLAILIGITVFGKENLPKNNEPCIIVANHNSHLDACTLMNLFPLSQLKRVRPVAAADYFMTNSFFSWFSTVLLNIIPIPRDNITRHNNPITTMGKALNEGDTLIIFPEGSRGEPEVLQEFKSGVAHLITKHPTIPVIPIFMKGMGRSLPKGEFTVVPFFCDVIIGTPKNYYQDCGKDKNKITEKIENDICTLGETLKRCFNSDSEK